MFQLDKPVEGMEEWLEAVSNARIPCAVVSNLDRRNLVEALERMGIKHYFQVASPYACALNCETSNSMAFVSPSVHSLHNKNLRVLFH